MEKAKRWSVTYTKHLKQKRKVYQDGVLQLDSSGHKVMLFDDCEKLLDSRFVKLDDIVKAGETITFGAYLVDIGDPEGDSKTLPTSNFQERDAKIVNRGALLHANKLKTNSTCTGNRKSTLGMYKAIPSNLSPSQKIIREFKKIEVKKYESSASCPNTIKENTEEWQVLYTTQITKKTKTFHDGSLRLVIRGSQGRQAMLYDATGRLLDSRFLKKDEMVTSGQSLTFDGHLVDIGECVGDHKPPTELNVQGRNCNEFQSAGVVLREQSQTCNKLPLEWDAMYTTQTTQRTKKYHDGLIRLDSCGSSRMQATLLTEDGTILGRRFLNLSETISTGSKFQLPNYLVKIGEPRRLREGEQNEASVSKYKDVKGGCSAMDNTKLSTRVPANGPLREPQDCASPLQDTKSKIRSSGADKIISGGKDLENKPLHNEWDAMYTTQTTQRTKKYHDGLIRLASCGSSRMQATLLTEDGTILGRIFLNLSEGISTGSTFQLPNYLVEIGEPRRHREGEQNEASLSKYNDVKVGRSAMDNTRLSTRANKLLREPQDSASPLQDTKSKIRSSGADKIISGGKDLENKPLRNAHAILSILKRPSICEGITEKGESLNEDLASQSSGFVPFDIQNQVQGQSVQGSCRRRIKMDYCHQETFMTHNSSGDASEKLIHIDHSKETIVSAEFNSREHGMDPPVPIALSLDSDSPTALEPYDDASKGNDIVGDLMEVLSSKATSSLKLNDQSEEVKHADPQQEPSGDSMDTNCTMRAGGLSFCKTTSTDGISLNHVEKGREASPQEKSTKIIDEFPSFDLGF